MVDRRAVLKLGAAGALGAAVNVPSQVFSKTEISPHRSLHRAIFDARYVDAVAFGEALSNRGVGVSGIRGDVAKLWYEDLRIHLRGDAAPIVGLTDRAALFCFEELARDVGLRVFLRVDHVRDQHGNVRHHSIGPASLVTAVHKLAPREGFGRSMALLVNYIDFDEAGDKTAQKRTGPYSPAGQNALVTWVIA
jgi:hypothetical protein